MRKRHPIERGDDQARELAKEILSSELGDLRGAITLLKFAKKGYLDGVKELVAQGVDPDRVFNFPDFKIGEKTRSVLDLSRPWCISPLWHALEGKNLEIFNFLLARVDLSEQNLLTLYCGAIQSFQSLDNPISESMLARSRNHKHFFTEALHQQIFSANLDIPLELLKSLESITGSPYEIFNTPLSLRSAIVNGSTSTMEYFLGGKPDVLRNIVCRIQQIEKIEEGLVEHDRVDVIEYLQSKEIDLDVANEEMLCVAIRSNKHLMVDYLLQKGVKIGQKSEKVIFHSLSSYGDPMSKDLALVLSKHSDEVAATLAILKYARQNTILQRVIMNNAKQIDKNGFLDDAPTLIYKLDTGVKTSTVEGALLFQDKEDGAIVSADSLLNK